MTTNWIAGAGFDVADRDACPNPVIACHSAGFAPQRQLRPIAAFAANARRYSDGRALMNVVDKVRGC
jgi:phosphoglycerate dehydrogenase-like enzyme